MPDSIRLDASCVGSCLVGQALDGMCVGIVLTGPNGRVSWMNRTAEAVLGAPRSDADGRPLGQVLRDPSIAEFWHRAQSESGVAMGEVSIAWPVPRTLKVNVSRCADPDGTCIGRAMLFCDVTDERHLQISLSQEAAQRLMSMTGSWQDGARDAPHAALTAQELRVLRLLGGGRSNAEIAAEMRVAASTVRSHLKHLYAKLGLDSRAEAILYAARHGLD